MALKKRYCVSVDFAQYREAVLGVSLRQARSSYDYSSDSNLTSVEVIFPGLQDCFPTNCVETKVAVVCSAQATYATTIASGHGKKCMALLSDYLVDQNLSCFF